MSNGFAHKLTYAGSDPYGPEEDREDITHEEYELLTQDEAYRKLAELRYISDVLEADLDGRDDVPDATQDALYEIYLGRDAPVKRAVDAYVDEWLADHRDGEEPEVSA